MSPPSWLPPLNSHHEFEVTEDACTQTPKYDPYRARPLFSIKIIVSVNFKSADQESKQRSFQGLFCEKVLTIPCHLVASESMFSEELVQMLVSQDETLIPFDVDLEILARNVWEFAYLMIQDASKYAAPHNILPFTYEIIKEVKIPDNELKAWNSWYDEKKRADLDFEKNYKDAISRPRTIEELAYETSLRFRAAVPSSIQELEAVRLDDCSSNDNSCLICLEELDLESTLVRLPCSHIFHGDCIKKWLEESHMCPLCRFELPFV